MFQIDQSLGKTAKILIGVFILLVLIVTSLAWYTLNQYKTDDSFSGTKTSTPSAKTATKSASSSTTKDETADWKTYTNTKYKFSFKYPTDSELAYGAGGIGAPYDVDENSDSIIVQPIQGDSSYFGFSVYPSNKSLGEIEKDFMKDKNNTDFSRVKVGGYEAIRFNYYGSIPTIKVIKDGNEFDFDITQDNTAYLDITNKIISTLKFL